jgi:hypothetical protein
MDFFMLVEVKAASMATNIAISIFVNYSRKENSSHYL